MKSIVVPVNFSATSTHAAQYAADLTAAIGGQLLLIHVFQLPPVVLENPMPDSAIDALRESASAQLRALAGELANRTAGRVPVDTVMETGAVNYRLEKYCEAQKPFMVVMGAAASAFDRFLSGSPTLEALRRLPYPLLVIPATVGFEKPERILVACDFEDIEKGMAGAVEFLRALKDLFGSDFQVINVTTAAEEGQGEAKYAFSAWRSRLRDIHPELNFLHTRTVVDGVEEYLDQHPADWLIVFPKKHAFLHRSQTRKLVLHSHLPVMSIHD